MVESAERVTGHSVEAVEKMLDQNAAQSAEEDFNKLDVSEIQETSHISKIDVSAIDSIEVSDFETALGVAFEKLDAIPSEGPVMSEPAFINHVLEQLMKSEGESRDRYTEWGKMLEGISENGLELSMDSEAIDASNPQEMFRHMRESLNRSLEYQQQFEIQAMELGVKIESMSWVRAIATTIVKGTRRLITQT